MDDLPSVQLELFLEAGANLAAQAARAGASAELIQGILRRAGEQTAVAADLKGKP